MSSQERVQKAIMSLGLSETDANVYIFLALNGPHTARDVSAKINHQKEQLYRSLKSLESKGIAERAVGHPAVFSVAPFEKVLDLLAEVRKEQENTLRDAREELLSSWQKVIKRNSKNN